MAQPTNTQRIGRRIAAARQCRGLEPGELAARASITQQRIERYEATGHLDCEELERIAVALRLPVDHFTGSCVLCGHVALPV